MLPAVFDHHRSLLEWDSRMLIDLQCTMGAQCLSKVEEKVEINCIEESNETVCLKILKKSFNIIFALQVGNQAQQLLKNSHNLNELWWIQYSPNKAVKTFLIELTQNFIEFDRIIMNLSQKWSLKSGMLLLGPNRLRNN